MNTRDELVKHLKTELDSMNVKIEEIELKAKSVSEASKAKIEERIKRLREQRDSTLVKINGVKEAVGETWRALIKGTEYAVNSLKNSISKTLENFTKSNNGPIRE